MRLASLAQARSKKTKQIVALKKITLHNESTDGFPLTSIREIAMLRECGEHPNVVDLYDIAVNSKKSVFLVFEYCPHDLAGLLDSHFKLRQKSLFKESEAKQLMLQLLSAISYLHKRNVLHRDLKASNLLYSENGQLKLADFGLARRGCLRGERRVGGGRRELIATNILLIYNIIAFGMTRLESELTPQVVSLWYRPIELLLGQTAYGEGVDNWGCGCLLVELLEGEPAFRGRSEIDQLEKILNFRGKIDLDIWPACEELEGWRRVKGVGGLGSLATPNQAGIYAQTSFSDHPASGLYSVSAAWIPTPASCIPG